MVDKLGLARDLESVRAGALDAAQFRRKYGAAVASSPTLEAVWANLDHYLADADIRARDSAYRDMQDGELKKLIELLQQRAPIEALRRITFLRSTEFRSGRLMKRLAGLKPEDFEVHPLWEYFGTDDDDAIVEPRSVDSLSEGGAAVLLAAAEFRLADGTAAAGYCSPTDNSGLDYLQPVLFIDNSAVPLWRPGLGVEAPSQISRELRKPVEDVFPIAWRCQILVDGEVKAGDIAKTDVAAAWPADAADDESP